MTLRDSTWFVVLLSKIFNCETFKRTDLGFQEPERHTVNRVLGAMEERGLLYRETEGSAQWHPGVVTRWYFSEESLTQQEREEVRDYLKPVAEQTEMDLDELMHPDFLS